MEMNCPTSSRRENYKLSASRAEKKKDRYIAFMKVHQSETGRDLVLAEYHPTATLWSAMPEMVARPFDCRTYKTMEDIHFFFLFSVHILAIDILRLEDFLALMAALHKRTVSPDGKFGFWFRGMQWTASAVLPLDGYLGGDVHGMWRIFDNGEGAQGYDEYKELKPVWNGQGSMQAFRDECWAERAWALLCAYNTRSVTSLAVIYSPHPAGTCLSRYLPCSATPPLIVVYKCSETRNCATSVLGKLLASYIY
jgi:hypothetical protein